MLCSVASLLAMAAHTFRQASNIKNASRPSRPLRH